MKNYCTSLFLLLVLFGFVPKSNVAQIINTQVMYRLRNSEQVLFTDEHRLRVYNGKLGSILFTEILTGKDTGQYIIYNGKALGPYQKIFYPEIFDFERNGDFKVIVQKKDKLYVNFNGSDYGPFEGLFGSGMANGNYYLHSLKNGDEYLTINGKELGKFTDLDNINVLENGKYLFTYKKGDFWVTNISGKEFKSAEQLQSISLKGENHFCYTYQTDGIWYVMADMKKIGPFQEVTELYMSDNADFGFVLKQGPRDFVNINGKMWGPYHEVLPSAMTMNNDKRLIFFDKTRFCFIYRKEKVQFVVINGNSFGPFDYIDQPKVTEDGKYYFIYRAKGKSFANINGKEYGPYDNVTIPYEWINHQDVHSYHFPVISDKGDFCFKFQRNARDYINLNGKEFGFDLKASSKTSGETEATEKYRTDILMSKDFNHFLLYCGDNQDIIIDGNKYYGSGGFAYIFSDYTNSFRWLSLKGREILISDYPLSNSSAIK